MSGLDLQADCSRCAALCCIAFPFERSAAFAEDKPAGRACARLSPAGRCSIHARRAEIGYGGCVDYDCHGAGQWVTQVLFAGRSWLEEPSLSAPMSDAFLRAVAVRRLLVLLDQAGRLDLTAEDRARLDGFVERIARAAGQGEGGDGLAAEVRGFLATLRRYVGAAPARRAGRSA